MQLTGAAAGAATAAQQKAAAAKPVEASEAATVFRKRHTRKQRESYEETASYEYMRQAGYLTRTQAR